jgi:hypothetical protein
MEPQSIVEAALQPVNSDLESIIYQRKAEGCAKDSDILRIITLMACIRTRALDKGWGPESDCELDEIKSILKCIETRI